MTRDLSKRVALSHPLRCRRDAVTGTFTSVSMKFIEMTGKSLAAIVKDDELHTGDLAAAGVVDTTVVRVNQHGDIEVRLEKSWDVIGGLLGNFEDRVRHQTGLDWA